MDNIFVHNSHANGPIAASQTWHAHTSLCHPTSPSSSPIPSPTNTQSHPHASSYAFSINLSVRDYQQFSPLKSPQFCQHSQGMLHKWYDRNILRQHCSSFARLHPPVMQRHAESPATMSVAPSPPHIHSLPILPPPPLPGSVILCLHHNYISDRLPAIITSQESASLSTFARYALQMI